MLLAIVLVMNGIYRGNIFDGVWLIENTATDLWVVERGRGGPFNESSRMPGTRTAASPPTPGVARASPFISYAAQREVGGASQQFTVIGYDVFGGLGGPGRLVAGPRHPGARTARWWPTRARPRARRSLPPRRARLHAWSASRSGAVDPGGNPLIYLSLPDAQEVLYRAGQPCARRRGAPPTCSGWSGRATRRSEAARLLPLLAASTASVNAVLVRLAPGADAEAVTQHIERWLHFSVYTTRRGARPDARGPAEEDGAVLGLFRSLLVVVSIVIIALIVYVLTIEKIRSIATLKLIGAPNRVIVRMILDAVAAAHAGQLRRSPTS